MSEGGLAGVSFFKYQLVFILFYFVLFYLFIYLFICGEGGILRNGIQTALFIGMD